MERRWMDGDIDESKVPQERIDLMYKDIHRELTRHLRLGRWARWSGVAAAIVIPLCLLFSISNYTELHRQSEQELLISTAKGEQSTITLPDGTSVKLNETSSLNYSPGRFGDKKRGISFEGEGFFEVRKKDDCPFIIEADKMTVTVLGTTFNLISRQSESFNTLYLVEGSVELLSLLTGETVILSPNEEATLDKKTGKVSVAKAKDFERETSWIRKELVLRRMSLNEVLAILSRNYNIEFVCSKDVDTSELFTGTMPSDNLLSCAEILEYAFGVKIKLSDNTATISK
ncbi:MAG: FecR domain-containing protein [Bacteroidales bacterium]|nr:FecR domain-containing protein [Bacteroidales bacterium]